MLTTARNGKSRAISVSSVSRSDTAIVVFNVEPDTFGTFFDALYWATVSLTTVGYGDIYPVSTIGRLLAMVSSIFGIAIVALPAGIITAGYMSAIGEPEQSEAERSE